MTLRTHIVVVDPVKPRELFDHCRDLLGCTDAHLWGHGDKRRAYVNDPGQELPAWLIVEHADDGPLLPDDEAPFAEHCADVSFDTGYSYDADGARASDLHAWLIIRVGEWLDERGIRWFWQHEFSGKWYPGTVSPDGILGDVALGALA